jgi:flagellar hook-associated protein 3 FlgL
MSQVNTRAAHTAAVARLSDLNRQLESVQGQISRGRRIDAPADDPVAFARAAVLRREQAAGTATQRAIDAAMRRLSATETTLTSVANLVQRARELALQGSNGTQSAADRQTIANELSELDAELRSLADARDSDGQRLFGGAIAGQPAYGIDANGVTVWQGGGRAPAVAVGASLVAGGSEGPDVFGVTDVAAGTRDLFAAFSALQAALVEPDPALRATGIATGITDLDGHVSGIANALGTIGARSGRLASETERQERVRLATETDLSKLESLDMPEAIARLQRLLTVLEAAQASFSRIASLSLWDQLR